MRNPFEYGSAVSGNAFYDREEIKRDIMNVLDGGNNVLLYGPRRYGKSSLVAQIFATLVERGETCVKIDMMEISSIESFISRYSEAVYRALSPSEGTFRKIAGAFKSLRPSLTLDENGMPVLSVTPGRKAVSEDDLCEVLDLPEKLAEGRRVVVAIDEFQEIARLMSGNAFERIMRSRIQYHHQVSYIFLGSRKHMLQRMFTSRKEPFYHSAEVFLLEKPPRKESEEFIIRRFGDVGIEISQNLAGRIVNLADNIPYYLQAIASWVFASAVARGGGCVDEEDISDGYCRMYRSKVDMYETLFSTFSESQRSLLIALASEPVGRFDSEYRSRHVLGGSSTVNTALKQLLESGDVEVVKQCNVVADPLFANFLKKCE